MPEIKIRGWIKKEEGGEQKKQLCVVQAKILPPLSLKLVSKGRSRSCVRCKVT